MRRSDRGQARIAECVGYRRSEVTMWLCPSRGRGRRAAARQYRSLPRRFSDRLDDCKWPGRVSVGFGLLARNLPFAAPQLLEFRGRREGPVLAGTTCSQLRQAADLGRSRPNGESQVPGAATDLRCRPGAALRGGPLSAVVRAPPGRTALPVLAASAADRRQRDGWALDELTTLRCVVMFSNDEGLTAHSSSGRPGGGRVCRNRRVEGA